MSNPGPADVARSVSALRRMARRLASPVRDATLFDVALALTFGAVAYASAEEQGARLPARILAGAFAALGSLARIRRHRRKGK